MATVDELIVQIKADTRDLNRKLRQLETNVSKASNSKSTRQLGSSLSALKGPAIAATAAIAGIGLAASSIIRTGAAFEDLKISLNSVTGSATAGSAAFDRIRDFAKTSPFQVKDLSKAFIQLKTAGIEPTSEMMTTFSDAASVTTDSLGAFQALVRITQRSVGGGLGLEELEQLSDRGIPVYEILAQKLGVARKEISDMGQSAEGAAKIMAALNEGLQESFGGTTAAKMDTVNQKFSTLTDELDGLSLAVFEEGGLGSLTKSILDDLIGAVAEASLLVKIMSTGKSREFFTAEDIKGRRDVLEEQIKEREKTPFSQIPMLDRFFDTEKSFKEDTAQMQRELDLLDNEILHQSIRNRQAQEKTIRDKADQSAKEESNKLAEEENKQMEKFLSLSQRTDSETKKLTESIARMREIAGSGDKTLIAQAFGDRDTETVLNGLNTILKDMEKSIEELDPEIEKVTRLFDEDMKSAIVNASNAFTNDFVNALLSGQSVLSSFKDFAKNVVSQIISTFLQLAVVNRILNTIFDLGLPQIGGGETEAQRSLRGRQEFVNYTGPKSAGGGRVSGATLVGERGPEIFIPNTGGNIMNNHSSRMAMGGNGVVVNQNLNFSTGVVPTVRQEIMKMLPTISDVTKASVLEAASRGGTYRRGLLGG